MSAILVPGRNSVKEIIKNNPKQISKLIIGVQNPDKTLNFLIEEALKNGIKLNRTRKEELDKLCPNTNHQGVVAELRERKYYSLKEYLNNSKEEDILLMLDSINDPHNFGAMLRASECFSVGGVVWSSNRGTGITPTVAKVSVGASELVRLIEVSNLLNTISVLKKAGYWIIAASNDEHSQSVYEFSFPKKSVLVMGSEGVGVAKSLLDNADFKIKIPLFGSIDSLNVSQATAVMLSHYRLQFLREVNLSY